MARRYTLMQSKTNTASSTVPMYLIRGASTFRFRIYDFVSGCEAVPTDDATNLQLQRSTAAGTASTSAAGVLALEPNDPATSVVVETGWTTTNPALTSNALLTVAQNTRATFRWVAAPDSELICPATTGNGIGLVSMVATTAKLFDWSTFWQE